MPDDDMDMIGARIPTSLNDELERYCDDLGIRKSEGVRRLLQTGLDENRPQSTTISLGAFFAVAGLGMIVASLIEPPNLAGRTGAVLLALGVFIELVPSIRDRLSQFYQRVGASEADSDQSR